MVNLINPASAALILILTANILVATQSTQPFTRSSDPHELENWFKRLPYTKEKSTHLHFYFPDKITTPPSFVEVARSPLTDTYPSQFGLVYVADDIITGTLSGGDELGRAQGILASADQKELAYFMGFNFVFTSGAYKGSTLTVLSRNPVLHTTREVAVVGGTGFFRMARGFAVLKTVVGADDSTVIEFNVFVLHY